ncbi:hypothetical protein JBKA6_0887 [Ichthyobacterium seriolicida]|uniref:Uncharacterized protein n=2 Tax=Ichthyobacterium seriolicida TaxID=242600 RepID=A0A1J1E4C6_9FLAO|nr:hypothetical protein JBKA6_0887 [Ichthyobacterium seriolicida]
MELQKSNNVNFLMGFLEDIDHSQDKTELQNTIDYIKKIDIKRISIGGILNATIFSTPIYCIISLILAFFLKKRQKT